MDLHDIDILDDIGAVVADFDTDAANYCAEAHPQISVSGLGTNTIHYKGLDPSAGVKVEFWGAQRCRIFLGANLKGYVHITVLGKDSTIYIGDDCDLFQLELRSSQSDDLIVVGNGVTTTAKNTWISGNGAGSGRPAIIIGDDCMFSYDVVIRNSDAHPVISVASGEQRNEPQGSVVIEPHVWIGERAAILKNVRIGACSIVALGSVVTADVPRLSVASGVPARSTARAETVWARSMAPADKARALEFYRRYAE